MEGLRERKAIARAPRATASSASYPRAQSRRGMRARAHGSRCPHDDVAAGAAVDVATNLGPSIPAVVSHAAASSTLKHTAARSRIATASAPLVELGPRRQRASAVAIAFSFLAANAAHAAVALSVQLRCRGRRGLRLSFAATAAASPHAAQSLSPASAALCATDRASPRHGTRRPRPRHAVYGRHHRC